MVSIFQIDRIPAFGPETFFITHFDYIQNENKLRGRIWGFENDMLRLYDATKNLGTIDQITEIRYVHIDSFPRHSRLQAVNLVCLVRHVS